MHYNHPYAQFGPATEDPKKKEQTLAASERKRELRRQRKRKLERRKARIREAIANGGKKSSSGS